MLFDFYFILPSFLPSYCLLALFYRVALVTFLVFGSLIYRVALITFLVFSSPIYRVALIPFLVFGSPTLLKLLSRFIAATAPLLRVRTIASLLSKHLLKLLVFLHLCCELLLFIRVFLSSCTSRALRDCNLSSISAISSRPELPSVGQECAKLVTAKDPLDHGALSHFLD